MEHPHDTHKRLTELEIKASFTEDLLEQLDQIIIRQQQQIDQLVREITRLQAPRADGSNSLPGNPRDELPPHY